jgi:hypothetical protein
MIVPATMEKLWTADGSKMKCKGAEFCHCSNQEVREEGGARSLQSRWQPAAWREINHRSRFAAARSAAEHGNLFTPRASLATSQMRRDFGETRLLSLKVRGSNGSVGGEWMLHSCVVCCGS